MMVFGQALNDWIEREIKYKDWILLDTMEEFGYDKYYNFNFEITEILCIFFA